MPQHILLSNLPAGYALHSCEKDGEVECVVREFTSSEDGSLFISRLEGLPRELLAAIPGNTVIQESAIDHMLAVIRPDKTAVLYINDLDHHIRIKAKGPLKKGTFVYLDQILDVNCIRLNNVEIGPNDGILFLFSAGWRKGLFFDLAPLISNGEPRRYNLETLLGSYYAYLWFQHIFAISDATWEELLNQKWFPFIHLSQELLKSIINAGNASRPIDQYLERISNEVLAAVESRLADWKSHPTLRSHYSIIETAFRHFQRKDYLSTCAMLFPRIEGVMRSNHFSDPMAPKATQENLVISTTSKACVSLHGKSLLLPDKFKRFLREVYYANFDPRNPRELSRNTVSHGVVPETALDHKGAVLAFLILLQMVSLLPKNESS